MWFGTIGGLNRFDGKYITQYSYSYGDTNGVYATEPLCFGSDSSHRFWIGFQTGMMEFDFVTKGFREVKPLKGVYVQRIICLNDSLLFLITPKGLVKYNPRQNSVFHYSSSSDTLQKKLLGTNFLNYFVQNGVIYLSKYDGIVKFHPHKNRVEELALPRNLEGGIRCFVFDAKGQLWIGSHTESKIYRLSPSLKIIKVYEEMLTTEARTQWYNIRGMLMDRTNRLWVTTFIDGLLEYDEKEDRFVKYLHDATIPFSPLNNKYRGIFQDNKGIIWVGNDVDGVTYFNPRRSIFQSVFQVANTPLNKQREVCRCFAIDQEGYYWLGTHNGLSRQHPQTKQSSFWGNDYSSASPLYHSAVRSMCCDSLGDVWIGTLGGVNRFNHSTGVLEKVAYSNLPSSLYNTITADRSGNLWFGCNSNDGLYWYNLKTKSFHSIREIQALKKYWGKEVSYVLEDSKRRYWISTTYQGVILYDPARETVREFKQSNTNQMGLAGNTVIDIKEDKTGLIWISCFNGVTSIDPEKIQFKTYNNRNGLAGCTVGPLAIDDSNRVWMGVNGGLAMLDADRKHFTTFTEKDGLSSIQFPEHAGVICRDGSVVFPSNNGFIKFNPMDYRTEQSAFPFYLSSYSLFGKEYNSIPENDSTLRLSLSPNQNSISFHLVALNYFNSKNTWYAYRLKGFEEAWHFTQDPKAVYTNLNGGHYLFEYKASYGNRNWETIPSKHITLQIETIYYKTIWFRIFLFLLLLALASGFYRYRTGQQKKLYQLYEKAQNLEKEKALVMYESLKQQLNPHFLFNSLTSLNSLINANPNLASDFLESLSSIYRYILKSRDHATVELRSEIEFAKTYVRLQKTRFSEGFDVVFEIPEEYLEYQIAPVTLQNLIENAIKHNIIDEETPLIVRIYCLNKTLCVENNLQRKEFVETSHRQGLASMDSLYQYLCGMPIEIVESENIFKIIVPLI